MDNSLFEEIFRPPRASAGPYTLDSPIRVDVWRSYAARPRPADPSQGAPTEAEKVEQLVDLLLEPTWEADTELIRDLGSACNARAGVELEHALPALAGGLVAVRLPFEAFLEIIFPATRWAGLVETARAMGPDELTTQLQEALRSERDGASHATRTLGDGETRVDQDSLDRLRWFLLLSVRIGFLDRRPPDEEARLVDPTDDDLRRGAEWLAERLAAADPGARRPTIYSVSVNRGAYASVNSSRRTIKVDAAERLFQASCADIGWAVLDSGIDARHPAFRKVGRDGHPVAEFSSPSESDPGVWQNNTRVRQTYNLTNARVALGAKSMAELPSFDLMQRLEYIKVDLAVPEKLYVPPAHDHGTHVAGILAANWRRDAAAGVEPVMTGICPDITLWDFRVLDDKGDGDEFSIVAGLHLVEEINRRAGRLRIHGVNLSLSLRHDVANFACGLTPVCRACDRLVESGVVVVAAAGNTGFSTRDKGASNESRSFHGISITDPGNAEDVITVGSTHGSLPYRYGVSYFSSRGPTADGRYKPDLLAPGEAITAPIPLIGDQGAADYKSYDGTSQAAAHVSGAAALLLARYPELRGKPREVKRVLCETASDLGRERYFQGFGLVDPLRAMQAR